MHEHWYVMIKKYIRPAMYHFLMTFCFRNDTHVIGYFHGNPSLTGGFPLKKASYAADAFFVV